MCRVVHSAYTELGRAGIRELCIPRDHSLSLDVPHDGRQIAPHAVALTTASCHHMFPVVRSRRVVQTSSGRANSRCHVTCRSTSLCSTCRSQTLEPRQSPALASRSITAGTH